jgi:hypothetical protein
MRRGNKNIKINRINAIVKKGLYKDEEIEIEIGDEGNNSKIMVNGKILNNVLGAHIHIRVGEKTKLCLELFKK